MGFQTFSIYVEFQVEDLLKHRGYEVLRRNYRWAGVELDRVFLDPIGQWVICEIKSISDWEYLHRRVTQKQVQRLQWAQRHLQYKFPQVVVRLHFAYFHSKNRELRVYDENGDEVLTT